MKGTPALIVKFVWHMSIVKEPEPEHVNNMLCSVPGHKLMLLNEPEFTMRKR